MPAQDFAGRTVADHVEAFTSGKVAARDIVEGLLERTKKATPSRHSTPTAPAPQPMRSMRGERAAARSARWPACRSRPRT
jgi:Merozoite surface antigen 2c